MAKTHNSSLSDIWTHNKEYKDRYQTLEKLTEIIDFLIDEALINGRMEKFLILNSQY